jgi:predicted nucleic-acid-binding Zn-ribbon protein
MNDIRRRELQPCAKCGSTRIIPRARVTELAPDSHEVSVRVAVTERPEALVFKGERRVDTYAKVCGECGYAELYVDDPLALYDSYMKSREPR